MTAYDSVERGAADECEPLRGRRPRTLTLTRPLVVCVVAACGCAVAATTAVNTHVLNIHEDYPEGAQLGRYFAKLLTGSRAAKTKLDVRNRRATVTWSLARHRRHPRGGGPWPALPQHCDGVNYGAEAAVTDAMRSKLAGSTFVSGFWRLRESHHSSWDYATRLRSTACQFGS